ncbi:MAG: hypothetical protein J6R37_01645 [Clostridia bacterium]|nr:hypothetical protein [Clostridia bacterium]
MKMAVTCDLFDIGWALKQIDEDYFLVFDTKTCKYEVHNKRQKPTLCFVVPYDCLDWRTVLFTRQTQVKNAQKLFEEMDKNNLELEKQAQRQQMENTHRLLEEL